MYLLSPTYSYFTTETGSLFFFYNLYFYFKFIYLHLTHPVSNLIVNQIKSYKEDKGWKEGTLLLSILPNQWQALVLVQTVTLLLLFISTFLELFSLRSKMKRLSVVEVHFCVTTTSDINELARTAGATAWRKLD